MDDDKIKRDFRVAFPPIIGAPDSPADTAEPPRSGQNCGNCDAFLTIGNQSVCAAVPPTPIFLGIQQGGTINPKTNQPQQYPIIAGFWGPTDEEKWCRQWKWCGPKVGK